MRRIILAGLALVAAATVFDIPTADAQVSSGRNPVVHPRRRRRPAAAGIAATTTAPSARRARAAPAAAAPPNPNYTVAGRQSKNPRRDNTWDGGT